MRTRILTAAAVTALTLVSSINAEKLTIIHTNDTHSQIGVADDGFGGVLRRKAIIDSVRATDPNVLLIDAGDGVQGTLYFTLYGGEVENKAMNLLGYDLAILGNHDFDNGLDALAKNLSQSQATWITTNYDFRDTKLDSLFVPYVIKEYDGKRIAFMGINLDPKGMISDRNYKGMKFLDIYKAANSTAWSLKHNERADMVVALTHIGYDDPSLPSDTALVAHSEDIDLVIGGHSHTTVDPDSPDSPAWLLSNLKGRMIPVLQTGSRGHNIGLISIDLDSLTIKPRLLPVDARYDDRIDPAAQAELLPYNSRIDSLMNIKVARTDRQLGNQELANLLSDLMLERGRELAGKNVDFAIINNGGIRRAFPAGMVSEGDVIMTLPFDNYIKVLKIRGSELIPTFNKMYERGINGVSSNVDATVDPASGECTEILISGKPLDPDKEYLLATLDYLANGGDYLVWLKNGEEIAESPVPLRTDMSRRLSKIKHPLNPSSATRIHY